MYEEEIKKVHERLSDVQRATVEVLYRRMYEEGQRRMLVADEVGLGKTWVAKGLVAKAFDQWQRNGDVGKKDFNVFYICSNQQLVAQNLKKINFTQNKRCIVRQVNRISLLAYKPDHTNTVFCIYALTPDTSFNEYSSIGIQEERMILYSILEDEFTDKVKLGKLLKGYWTLKYWKPQENCTKYKGRLRDGLAETFTQHIRDTEVDGKKCPETYEYYGFTDKMSLLEFVKNVVSRFDECRKWKIYEEPISLLRSALIDVCLSYMDADIFILDEFQRYSQLLDAKDQSRNERTTIAQKVFSEQEAKVLMLSATPFKAFTNRHDETNGEQHYKELERVLKFLYEGTEVDWQQYEKNRSELFSKMLELRQSENRDALLKVIEKLKRDVEDLYAKVIVRTEKIIASNDPNAMIKKDEVKPLPITAQEIADFVNLDAVFSAIYASKKENAPSPIDYAKSAPYAMSYLKDYKVGEKALNLHLPLHKNAFVNLSEVNRYEFPKSGIWPSGKLNILMKDVRKEAQLLWCPPSMEYYKSEGAFLGQRNFTKTLIFSAWKLVPKMIATLVSYEAERQSLGRLPKEDGIKYFADKRVASQGDKARKPYRKLVFSSSHRKNQEPVLKNMTTLLLAYPSRRLESIVDPLDYINKGVTSKKIISDFCIPIKDEIAALCKEKGNAEDKENTHISWAFPMIKDAGKDNRWLNGLEQKIEKKSSETILTKEYISELRAILTNETHVPLFPSKPSLEEIKRQACLMVQLSLGSPAICAYRALKRYFGDTPETLSTAFLIGLAFLDMFNKPESIAIVELQYPQKSLDYWQKVIRYCIDGNLQAVMDEYVFMLLNECDTSTDIGEVICNVLSMRTVNIKIDDGESFCKKESKDTDIRHSLRAHYAAAFGINAKSSQGSEIRATSIREAFNSPFRPFVLTTTSIGQEGLDFHWYCRRVIHWNLPNNPIDFEQREGRINRFRGKVIRQRVADKYTKELTADNQSPWDILFRKAENDKKNAKFPCDIVPSWHFDYDGVGIERIVPLYQFSQDIQRYEEMQKILGLYRLTFGQPRQEELAKALDAALSPEETDKLLIDLCPLRREQKSRNE